MCYKLKFTLKIQITKGSLNIRIIKKFIKLFYFFVLMYLYKNRFLYLLKMKYKNILHCLFIKITFSSLIEDIWKSHGRIWIIH